MSGETELIGAIASRLRPFGPETRLEGQEKRVSTVPDPVQQVCRMITAAVRAELHVVLREQVSEVEGKPDGHSGLDNIETIPARSALH